MISVPLILLIVFAIVLTYFLSTDEKQYRRFKAFAESRDRQRFYATWFTKSFLAFGAGSVASLAWLGQLHALVQTPAAFAPITQRLQASAYVDAGVAGVVVGVLAAIALLQTFLVRRARAAKPKATTEPKQIAGNGLQPLLPRNAAERWWAALLSLDAGLSEELFFRLVLPLVLVLVLGNVYLAFAIAIVTFGVMHFYQGWAGVVATSIVGIVMAMVYLASGNIWVAVIVHAAIDLNGMLLMPYLARRKIRRATAS
jgi:membrane protease YdiL (CAAX protease family)